MEILEKLIALGADLNAPDSYGYTALHFCFLLADDENDIHFKMATKLLEAGANVDVRNRQQVTPLYIALEMEKSVEIIDLLIRFKADPYIKDMAGRTVFDRACMCDVELFMRLHKNDEERVKKSKEEAMEKTNFMKCGNCKVKNFHIF